MSFHTLQLDGSRIPPQGDPILAGRVLISAAMIVRNEAATLGKCIESVRAVVDEIVVVDTGSTDGTIEIARDHGARVFQEKWRDDFSAHRNGSLDRCSGDWAFVIDGDEELVDPGNLREMIIEAEAHEADGVGVRVTALTDAGVGEQYFSVRAFRRDRGRYRYPVHNRLTGIRRRVPSTAVLMTHYEGTMERKAARSIPLLEQLFREDPEDPHAPFFLCKTYRAIGDAERTLAWGRRCAELVPDAAEYASFWVWAFEAALAVEGIESAAALLDELGDRHRGLADLEHCRLAVAAIRWQQAAVTPGVYAFAPQTSLQFVPGLRTAAPLLGLPFAVEDR